MEALEGAPGRPAAAQEEIVNEEATRGAMPVDPESILRTSLIYQRLDSLGLCGHVRCLFLHKSDGSAGALIVDDRTSFLEALRATGRFCEDSPRGGMLHGGRRSFREIAPDSGEALHFTVAAGDYIWVHVDRVSPSVEAKSDGRCRYQGRRAAAHIRRDVVPLLLGSRDRTKGPTGSDEEQPPTVPPRRGSRRLRGASVGRVSR